MSPRRGFLTATLLAALLNGGAVSADEPAGAAAQRETSTGQTAAAAPDTTPVPGTAPAPTTVTAPAPATSPVVAPASSAAQPATPLAARATGPAAGNTSGMISGLIFLLLLVLGAAWLIRRTGGMPALRGGSSMKVVAALSVGPRERVVLIEVGGQQWLLGVGAGSVNALHHFEQPIVADNSDDFAGKLRQLWPQAIGSHGLRSQGPDSQGQRK